MSDNFLGYKYPITQTPQGYFPLNFGVNQVRSDLLILLLTNPGERLMLPQFGTPLNTLLFQQNDAATSAQAQQLISNAISMWEPRITVTSIQVTNSGVASLLNPNDNLTENNNVLTIQLQFLYDDNITEVQSLVLEVPLPGS